jgi:hypothetical protein
MNTPEKQAQAPQMTCQKNIVVLCLFSDEDSTARKTYRYERKAALLLLLSLRAQKIERLHKKCANIILSRNVTRLMLRTFTADSGHDPNC